MAMSIITSLFIGMTTLQIPERAKEILSLDEVRIRELLGSEEGIDWIELTRLRGMSSDALPLYARIIDGPKEDSYIVTRTLVVLANSEMKADRSEFLDRAIAKLADPHPGIRQTAVELLARIGSARDAPPVVALLADEKFEIPMAAAKTLAAIGDRRSLAALNVWLATGRRLDNPNNDAVQRQRVAQFRDELKRRLDAARPPAK